LHFLIIKSAGARLSPPPAFPERLQFPVLASATGEELVALGVCLWDISRWFERYLLVMSTHANAPCPAGGGVPLVCDRI